MKKHRSSYMDDSEEQLEQSSRSGDSKTLCFSKDFRKELKMNVTMAFPVMITNFFQYSLNIETTAFCGRISSTDLEGVGLALSLLSALGWCVCSGMVSACDTMFAQSFGSDNKKRTGLFLQRSFLLMNLVPICLWALHINFEPILVLCKQDPDISKVTGEFLIAFTPGIMFMMNYLLMARYMQDQGCLWPPVIAAVCGNIFNVCSQLFFVTYMGYGIRAAAISHAMSFGLMALLEIVYIWKSKFYVATWPGFQLEALCDWSGMFRLGLAGVGHITFEVIIWEASIFMGGILGSVQLATQSIMMQLLTVSFMLYYGAGIASNIRVGQCLGANRPDLARLAYRSGLLATGIAVIFLTSLIMSLRYQIPYIFTNQSEVIAMVVDVLPFMYVLIFIDPFSGILSASLRGCGRQFSGCIVMFIAFYILSLPTSIVLAFVFNFNIKGIWIGCTLGSVVSVSSGFVLLECQNWEKQAFLAQQRILCNLTPEDDETENLIPSNSLEIDEVVKLPSHIRTPSHPIMCSIDVVKMPKPRMNVDRSIIRKRLLIAGGVVLFFLLGLMIHIFLPRELYRSNSTIINP